MHRLFKYNADQKRTYRLFYLRQPEYSIALLLLGAEKRKTMEHTKTPWRLGRKGVKMKRVRCCECMWEGDEEDLLHIDDGINEPQDACPNCKTDEYLLDLE